jgi:hypothetical protein
VVGVDDGVGLVGEAVDAADLVQVGLPLRGMLYHDAEVDVCVLCLDATGDLLAIGGVQTVS